MQIQVRDKSELMSKFRDDPFIFRPCDVFAHCTNNIGSYECTCFPGYEGDGHTCQGRSNDSDDDRMIPPEICREIYPLL